MTEARLSEFLHRTEEFHRAVAAQLCCVEPLPKMRYVVAFQAGLMSIEHAAGALILISSGLCASGFSLFRPQFETLVRGIWLLYAASDSWVTKLSEPLTLETAKKANEGVGLADMLIELDASNAPPQLIAQIKQYRDVNWKALNSYAHGGIHPIARNMNGYPPQLSIDALRNSNALVAFSAQLAAIVSGDESNMQPVRQLHVDFADCIPIIENK